MELSQLPILAGSVATIIFVGSYLPMLVRAMRTRNVSSYSRSSLVLANIGNLVQTAYVVTLPVGPIWGLHAFYVLATLMMLVLHLRHAHPASQRKSVSVEDLSRDIQFARKPRQRAGKQLGLLRVGILGGSRQVRGSAAARLRLGQVADQPSVWRHRFRAAGHADGGVDLRQVHRKHGRFRGAQG